MVALLRVDGWHVAAIAWAHAAAQVDASQVLQLTGPAIAPARGPTLILGPGTGLGAAVWIPVGARTCRSNTRCPAPAC